MYTPYFLCTRTVVGMGCCLEKFMGSYERGDEWTTYGYNLNLGASSLMCNYNEPLNGAHSSM